MWDACARSSGGLEAIWSDTAKFCINSRAADRRLYPGTLRYDCLYINCYSNASRSFSKVFIVMSVQSRLLFNSSGSALIPTTIYIMSSDSHQLWV